MIINKFGSYVFDDIFEKIYLSHHIHLRKPDKEIFLYVIHENKLVLGETLFIDDSPQHIEGARKAGLHTMLFEKGKKLNEISFD